MTQEEKAKAYDVALERAKAFNKRWQCVQAMDSELALKELKEIFPELMESKDERIMKALIRFHKSTIDIDGIKGNEILAWLEKQGEKPVIEMKSPEESLGISSKEYNEIVNECLYGEQKPADKVEPKFKVGDWVFIEEIKGYKQGAFQIKSVDEFGYNFDECDAIPFKYEEFLSKWTINDTKDGEVLAEDTCTFIIKKLNRDLSAEIYCCLYDDGDFEANTTLVFDDTSTYPATKEQRNLLFQKMKEAGYEWDENNKMLKEIVEDEEESQNYKNQVMSEITDLVKHYIKQKPTCNETGEEQLNSLREEYKMTQEGKNMIIEELLRQKRRFELEKSTLTHNSDNYHELRGRIWAYNDAIAFINSI